MFDNFPFKIKIEALDGFSPKLQEITKGINQTAKAFDRFGQEVTKKISLPFAAIIGLSLKSYSEFENLTIQFETILGSAEKASSTIKDLMKFSASTPFETVEVANVAKTFIAGNVALGKDLNNLLRLTGDIAAGSGKSIEEIANPISKVLQKGKASLEEIYPLAERGIPIIQELQNVTKLDRSSLFKAIEKGAVSTKVFLNALDNLNDKGNRFYQATDKLSQSLSGLASTLKDSVNFALIEMGAEIVKVLDLQDLVKGLTDWISSATEAFKNLPEPFKAAIAGFILFGAILGPVIFALGQIGFAFGGLMFGINAIIPLIAGIPAVLAGASAAFGFLSLAIRGVWLAVTGPWGLAIAGIVLAAGLLIANWEPVSKFFKGFFDWFTKILGESASKLGNLIGKIPFGKSEFNVSQVQRTVIDDARSNMANTGAGSRSNLDVNFSNIPRGTQVQSGGNSDMNLNLGYSFLTP